MHSPLGAFNVFDFSVFGNKKGAKMLFYLHCYHYKHILQNCLGKRSNSPRKFSPRIIFAPKLFLGSNVPLTFHFGFKSALFGWSTKHWPLSDYVDIKKLSWHVRWHYLVLVSIFILETHVCTCQNKRDLIKKNKTKQKKKANQGNPSKQNQSSNN